MDLTGRNAAAIDETLRQVTGLVLAQQTRIDGLFATMATLVARMKHLECLVIAHKVETTGHGPTVKEK